MSPHYQPEVLWVCAGPRDFQVDEWGVGAVEDYFAVIVGVT